MSSFSTMGIVSSAALLVLLMVGGSNVQNVLFRFAGVGIGLIFLGRALYEVDWRSFYAQDRLAAALLVGLISLFVAQLVPLPAWIWSGLPGRDLVVYGDTLMMGSLSARPFSLDPDATIANAVWFFAPIGMYAFLRAAPDSRRIEWFFAIFLVFATLSLVLEVSQSLFGWPDIYVIKGSTFPNGLFANRNHQAVMLDCAIPLGTAFIARYALAERFARRVGISGRLAGWVLIVGLVIPCAVGALLTGSRTGSLLLIPAIIMATVINKGAAGVSRRTLGIIFGAVLLVAVAFFVLPKIGGPLGQVFSRGLGGDEDRFRYWPAIYDAASVYFPYGSGIGTFDRVFQISEPIKVLSPLHLYNAHNDWLELALETGVFGVALAAVFLLWLGRRGWGAWRRPDAVFQRAASAVIILLLLHSFVDYPLRMTALAVLLAAAACVLSRDGRGPATTLRSTGI